MTEYVPISGCYTCLEHYLLYVDFGLSEATAGFLSGLFHVTDTNDHFKGLAQEFLRGRVRPSN